LEKIKNIDCIVNKKIKSLEKTISYLNEKNSMKDNKIINKVIKE
jgi:hypothetical protein